MCPWDSQHNNVNNNSNNNFRGLTQVKHAPKVATFRPPFCTQHLQDTAAAHPPPPQPAHHSTAPAHLYRTLCRSPTCATQRCGCVRRRHGRQRPADGTDLRWGCRLQRTSAAAVSWLLVQWTWRRKGGNRGKDKDNRLKVK